MPNKESTPSDSSQSPRRASPAPVAVVANAAAAAASARLAPPPLKSKNSAGPTRSPTASPVGYGPHLFDNMYCLHIVIVYLVVIRISVNLTRAKCFCRSTPVLPSKAPTSGTSEPSLSILDLPVNLPAAHDTSLPSPLLTGELIWVTMTAAYAIVSFVSMQLRF